jgi:predicted secreted protein
MANEAATGSGAAMSKSVEHRCPLVEKWRKPRFEFQGVTLAYDEDTLSAREQCAGELEQFWRERVEPLIEAGQAQQSILLRTYVTMLTREDGDTYYHCAECGFDTPAKEAFKLEESMHEDICALGKWDAALAKVKEP